MDNKRTLDIAVIIPELRKHGGAERFLMECLVRWQNRHKITVYATAFNESLFEEAGLSRVATRLLSPRYEGPHATLLNATLLPKIWESEIDRHDIYHTHLWPTHLLDLHPMVWYPHEPLRLLYDLRYAQVDDEAIDDMQKKLHFYPKETYDSVNGKEYEAILRTIEAFDKVGTPDRIVGNSRYTVDYLQRVYGRKVTDCVYPGVTVEDMLELPGSRDIVLTIGQLWPHKRMRLIIEALSHIDGVQLYIVGSGPEKERLKKIAARMGVADRVFFLQGLDNHEVQILLARCLCVVFTPAREPFGIVALEALAAGKPLIAVNEGGFTEVVDKRCAVLVPPQPVAIAEQIRRLQQEPKLADRMGRHGREVAARYSWDRSASELLAIIEQTHQQWSQEHAEKKGDDGPLFAAHYFLWYKEGFGSAHWCDNPTSGWVTDSSSLGYYSSMSGDAINAHLDQMESIGLDVVVLNVHAGEVGLEVYQLHAAQRMMEIARKRRSPLRFALNLCLYTRDPSLVLSAFSMARDGLMGQDNYFKHEGKPVFMFFWTGAFDGDVRLIEQVRHLSEDCLKFGVYMRPHDPASEPRKSFGLFDSISQFAPLELGPAQLWEKIWQREYEDSGASSGYRCLTVCPGYDDSHLQDPSRKGGVRTVDPLDGATYQRMLTFALEQERPFFVFITSFNEFHENTHIEPSLRNGSRYLDMTREFIAKARKKWKSKPHRQKQGPTSKKSKKGIAK